MTPKQFLKQSFKIVHQIEAKCARLEELRAMAERMTPILTGMPSGSGGSSKLEDAVIRIADMEAEIAEEYNAATILLQDITAAIKAVEKPDQRTLLELRYLAYRSWPEIADALYLSERQAYRLHGQALLNVRVPEQYQHGSKCQ